MKTRSLAVALSLALMLGMAGCGGQQAQQELQEPDQGKVQQSEPASTTPQFESMEVKNENDTAMPLADLEDIEPEEADGAGIFEGSGSVEVELFTEVNETVYATGTVNIRASYAADSDKLGSLSVGQSVTRTGTSIAGTEAEGWSRVELSDGTTAYISNKYLSTTKPVAQQPSGGSTQGKPSGQTQQQQPTQQQTQQQPSGQPSGSTDAEVDMDAWAARRQQMLIEQGYQGTDPSKRMDINDPNYADWVHGLVGELNGD
ncbi:SH3 domain-containing protein [uncultured Oscillibacter sp.]|uniref:SH3 domain-containing protein n=1 Tax=uncultured Oscillibacter sp. TaxID=876091 RepID=UPI0025F4E0C5|nr:SH3 domain-containing protein [uncultured Oscillibacter sp.]